MRDIEVRVVACGSRRRSLQVKERLDAIYGKEESALGPGHGKLQARSLPPAER